MTQKINKSTLIIWQEVEEGVGEPALLIRTYNVGMIGIQQGDREILINEEIVPELLKLLKHYSSNEDFENFIVK